MISQTPSPDFFIIGAPKCGTTALAQYLSEHPSVFFCVPKEPFFWATDHLKARGINDLHSLEDYLGLFATADPVRHRSIGEGSTTYLQSHAAVAEILKFRPDAKFIVMLRNPIDVVHGMHGELMRHFAEDETDFEKAWALQADRAAGKHVPANDRFAHQLQYHDVASFAPQLRRLFDQVPEHRRRIILFDDFIQDARTVYHDTLNFLGLPDDGRSEFPKVNAAGNYRMQSLGRLAHHPPAIIAGPVKLFRAWYIRRGGRMKQMLHRLVQKESPRESLRPVFREHLKNVFRDDIEQTSQLLGRDLTEWTRTATSASSATKTVSLSEPSGATVL